MGRSLPEMLELEDRLQSQIDQSRSVLNRIDADWPLCCFMPDELHTIRKDTAAYLRSLHRDMVRLAATKRTVRPPDAAFVFHPVFSCATET